MVILKYNLAPEHILHSQFPFINISQQHKLTEFKYITNKNLGTEYRKKNGKGYTAFEVCHMKLSMMKWKLIGLI